MYQPQVNSRASLAASPQGQQGGQPPASVPWWVINSTPPSQPKVAPRLTVVQAKLKPKNYFAGPFKTKADAQAFLKQGEEGGGNPFSAVGGWLGSIGGMLGSGIEAGFIAIVQDLWDNIVGPVEVIVGFIVLVVVIVIYFKDDIMALAPLIAAAAA